MSHSALSNLSQIIVQLKQSAQEVDDANKQNKAHKLLAGSEIFSIALFKSRADRLIPYVLETEKNIKELEYLLLKNKNDIAYLLIETIEHQILALKNAIASNGVINKEAKIRQQKLTALKYKKHAQNAFASSHELYKKLAEYHEFERRLDNMLKESNHKGDTEQSLVIHQRLGRCRQAISKVEWQIELLEKKTSLS